MGNHALQLLRGELGALQLQLGGAEQLRHHLCCAAHVRLALLARVYNELLLRRLLRGAHRLTLKSTPALTYSLTLSRHIKLLAQALGEHARPLLLMAK